MSTVVELSMVGRDAICMQLCMFDLHVGVIKSHWQGIWLVLYGNQLQLEISWTLFICFKNPCSWVCKSVEIRGCLPVSERCGTNTAGR